jgi:sigma-B regulation protein RsbU (phosphoserine phosphatase)
MQNSEPTAAVHIESIVDSLGDGVYTCDPDRRITYWSGSAQRITGWTAEEVVGRHCFDNVLSHIDKDGNPLCGKERCPLHRAMVTGRSSSGSLLIYAKAKDGRRIPMHVSVAPIRNPAGQMVGGVETFRDASRVVVDLERAKAIQQLALRNDLPRDPRVKFTTRYIPCDIIGGDYFAITKLGDDQYGLVLADVTGHGVAAALYTMHLSQLWDRFHTLLTTPVEFAARVNNELAKLVGTDESFATAVCALVDLKDQTFRFAGAGGPQVLLLHSDGTHDCLEQPGLPLGIMEGACYDETSVAIQEGDRLLLFSDGAIETSNAAGETLGVDGLVRILKEQGYPGNGIRLESLEERLLRYSDTIRLADDLTLIEICL